MSEYVYSMYRADKFYGPDRQVLANISLSFLHGAKIGVLGPNGAGKSTLLRVMAGREQTSSGEAQLAPGATVGLLEQEPRARSREGRARQRRGRRARAARPARPLQGGLGGFAEPDADFDALLAEQAKVQEEIDRRDGWTLEATLDRAMDALRLPGGDRDVDDALGRRAAPRGALPAAALLARPAAARRADEPSRRRVGRWLERFLAEYKGTVVAVTHDRYFLDNVAGWILELDRGRGIPFEGNYSSWLEQKQARLAIEEKQESARRRTLARELEWVRMSPRARHAKSKARLASYEKLLAEEQHVKLDRVEIHIPPGPRLGDVVIEATSVVEGLRRPAAVRGHEVLAATRRDRRRDRPERRRQDDAVPADRRRGAPDAGTLKVGETVAARLRRPVARRARPEETVWKEISGGLDTIELGRREMNSRQYTSWFNFRGGDQQKPVGELSGGERNRVHLAKLLRSGGNVLLLDEPTNDLDVDTLRALEEALLDFAGCAVVITHDRWFLDRVATHILAFEGDSQVTWFEGTWGEYAEWVTETRGAEALEPHRIKYKPLVRA